MNSKLLLSQIKINIQENINKSRQEIGFYTIFISTYLKNEEASGSLLL